MAPCKVLVGLDESAPSFRALHWAARRGAAANDEVWALAVLDKRRVMLDARQGSRQRRGGESYSERLQRLLDQAKHAAAGLGVALQVELRASDEPASALVDFASEGGFAEIVLGHREKRGVEKVVLGSTALRVLELTQIPVTIVR